MVEQSGKDYAKIIQTADLDREVLILPQLQLFSFVITLFPRLIPFVPT